MHMAGKFCKRVIHRLYIGWENQNSLNAHICKILAKKFMLQRDEVAAGRNWHHPVFASQHRLTIILCQPFSSICIIETIPIVRTLERRTRPGSVCQWQDIGEGTKSPHRAAEGLRGAQQKSPRQCPGLIRQNCISRNQERKERLPPVKRYTRKRKRMEIATPVRKRPNNQKKAMVKNAIKIPPFQKNYGIGLF